MFGAVCSIPMQERLAAGKKISEKLGVAKRLVSRQWFDPISYRTLQNALIPVRKGKRKGAISKVGQELRKRNGTTDPLRRTFLIIDEVHKLMDGDLKASEMADFDEIARMIQNSYDRSGDDSVRLLLMTATPITDNPEGLFRLLNLLIPNKSAQLPSVAEFRHTYTTADGKITGEGVAFFQDRTKGLISYLNREFDPSTFAQPRFHELRIPATGAMPPTDEALLRGCWDAEMAGEPDEVEVDCGALAGELEAALEELEEYEFLPKELAARRKTLKAGYKTRIADCKKRGKDRTRRMKLRIGAVQHCVGQAAKTRKKLYSISQQKATRKCFGKLAYGSQPKFSSVGDLRRMVKNGRPASPRRSAAQTVSSTRALAGPESPTVSPQLRSRSATPKNRAVYAAKKTRRDRRRGHRRDRRRSHSSNNNNNNNTNNNNNND